MLEKFIENPYNKLIILAVKEEREESEVQEISRLLQKVDAEKLFETAKKYEVASIMYPVIREYVKGAEWEKEYSEVKEQIAWMMEAAQKTAGILKEQGIPLLALKNAGIAMAFMDDYGKCPMGDIDTLVPKELFKKAHQTVLNNGFEFQFRSAYEEEDLQTAFLDGSTEYLYQSDGRKMWLEIAWRAIAGRWINRKKEPETDQLFAEAVYLKEKGIYILGPEDNLLQVSIHTAKHSYVRKPGFRLHLDVERIVRHTGIDWELFLTKVQKAHTKTAVYFSLKCAADLFKTPIPEKVLQELKPARLKEWYIKKTIEKCLELHQCGHKMHRIQFLLFQTCLYDNWKEAWQVAFPGKAFLKNRYPETGAFRAQCRHLLDLAGIRKEKSLGANEKRESL